MVALVFYISEYLPPVKVTTSSLACQNNEGCNVESILEPYEKKHTYASLIHSYYNNKVEEIQIIESSLQQTILYI